MQFAPTGTPVFFDANLYTLSLMQTPCEGFKQYWGGQQVKICWQNRVEFIVACFIHMHTVLLMFYCRDSLPFDIKLSYRIIALIMINTIND